ncbi:MAG: STAS domain-containing protein [Planctomycetota bacterium]|jgi:stage II sporulation protein AA (anti-sigma F factor antagonist)
MEMQIDDQPDLLTLRMKGSFDELSADWFDVLSSRIERVPVDILMNMDSVSYIDSKGLGALFSLHKHVEDLGYHMFFSQISDNLREVFDLAGLQHILRIYKNDEDALHAIKLCQVRRRN